MNKNQFDIFTFDTETYKDGKFKIGVIYNGYIYKRYVTELDFIDGVLNEKRKFGYAHNLSYDTVGIFNHQKEGHFLVNSGKFIAFKYNKKKILIDSTNYFGMIPLENIAKIYCGESKTLAKENYDEIFNLDDENLFKLCEKDTKILYDSLEAFFKLMLFEYKDKNDFKIKYTTPSYTLQIFQDNFLKNSYDVSNKEGEKEYEKDFIKKSYYGGRTEVFNLNKVKGKIYYYDINSMYPYVMQNNKFGLIGTEVIKNGRVCHKRYLKYFGISDVLIECPDDIYIPILPKKIKGKLIFPTGIFSGVYTHAELNFAVERGYKIKEIYKQILWKKTDYVFKEYINHFYSKRELAKEEIVKAEKNNDKNNLIKYKGLSNFYKLFLNSLYGKFGMSEKFTSLYTNPMDYARLEDSNEVLFQISSDNFYAILTETESSLNFNNIIWATYVTSLARIELYKYMELLDFNVLYCDTDSLISKIKLDDKFLSDSKLGMLAIENILKVFHAKKPKMYYFKTLENKEVYKVKGVGKNKNPKEKLNKKTGKMEVVKKKNKETGKMEVVMISNQEIYFNTGKAVKISPVKPLQYAHNRKAVLDGNNPKRIYKHINNWIEWVKEERTEYSKRIVLENNQTIPIKIEENQNIYLTENYT